MYDIFSTFEGNWNLSRNITGYTPIKGLASFTKYSDNDMLYEEKCVLILNNNKINNYRTYHYYYDDDNIVLLFVKDKGLFYKLDFIEPCKAIAQHICNEDIYDAIYYFHNKDEFSISYIVKGPFKNYKSDTFFQRLN